MKRKPTFTSSLGSISDLYNETTEDHIDSLAYELRRLMKRCRVRREDRKAFTAMLRRFEITPDEDEERAQLRAEIRLKALIEALETFAPPYCTFSRRGKSYGFWPAIDLNHCDALARLEAGLEHREHWGNGDVLLVNDHGNASCGRFDKRGQFHEYWAIV